MMVNDIFLDRLPSIDLHGYDRDSARVAVNDFVYEACVMGYDRVVIIHGKGQGIVRDMVQQTLRVNDNVVSYHVDGFNNGCTVVFLRAGSNFDVDIN